MKIALLRRLDKVKMYFMLTINKKQNTHNDPRKVCTSWLENITIFHLGWILLRKIYIKVGIIVYELKFIAKGSFITFQPKFLNKLQRHVYINRK